LSQPAAGEGNAPATPGRELLARVVSAVALALIALVGALFGGWAAATVIAIVLAIVHLEWANITDHSPWPTAVFTAGLVIAIAMFTMGLHVGGLTIVALAILAAAATWDVWRPLGVLYASLLGFGLLTLRLSPDAGLAAVLFVLAVVTATDTGAFFVGRRIGGAKLWPRVSPNKTWAGAIGGLVAGVIAGFVALALLGVPVSPPLAAIVVVLSIAAEAGDLFESFVKRQFGAKDSGRLLPGHGGLMDRVDGLAVAAGLAAMIGWFHAGGDIGRGLLAW
jgi:phosphatidate cytidylyltransferase